MLSFRVITKESCLKCKFYIKVLKHHGYQFETFDANAKENQKQLDVWRITNMPVVQIIEHQEDAEVVVLFQFGFGQISPRVLNRTIKIILKKREKVKQMGDS